jgi:hypothetical protein
VNQQAIDRATSLARRLLPQERYEQLRRGYRAATRTQLNDELMTSRGARFSGLASSFITASRIPGYFTYDDALVFTTILKMQSSFLLRGDLFEIGTYQGRSAAFLAMCLQPGERLVVNDAFQTETYDTYIDRPSPQTLLKNVRSVVPDLDEDRIRIIEGLSTEITIADDQRFRFAHVDGGHSYETALSDLLLCAEHMVPGGIIAVDDYENYAWPEVTPAVNEFLKRRTDVSVLMDINRQGAIGRKIYLQI